MFLSATAVREARLVWVKFSQSRIKKDQQDSVIKTGVKIHGLFIQMSPFEVENRVWRVGSRIGDFTPLTQNNKPAIILPNDCPYTYLLMKKGS